MHEFCMKAIEKQILQQRKEYLLKRLSENNTPKIKIREEVKVERVGTSLMITGCGKPYSVKINEIIDVKSCEYYTIKNLETKWVVELKINHFVGNGFLGIPKYEQKTRCFYFTSQLGEDFSVVKNLAKQLHKDILANI